ncbi:hypothetical protein YPPY53_4691, partial [Yersinia pestis PY-53]
MPATERTGRS